MKRRDFLKILGVSAAAATIPLGELPKTKHKIRGPKALFVDSNKGSDFFNKGINPKRPLETLNAAIDRSDSGGIIIISPGHVEWLKKAVIVDKSVHIICYKNNKNNSPRFLL